MVRTVVVLVITFLGVGQVYCYGRQDDGSMKAAKSSTLRIYLPREVVVKADSIQLGEVGIV